MLAELKDKRLSKRVNEKLFLHIYNEQRIFTGKTIDLSCWGLRFKSANELEVGDVIRVHFVYNETYILNTKIVQKVSENEYRGIFLFDDLHKKIMLERSIEK
jgi:hypothetical protein